MGKMVMDLIMSMMAYGTFKEEMILTIIGCYNKYRHFESSQFEKILIVLLSESKTVECAMKKAVVSLDPSLREYDSRKYYTHLLYLQWLKPEVV
jgi:hypothetical protein